VTELVIPLARIRRTVKMDPDVKNISKEATVIMAKVVHFVVTILCTELTLPPPLPTLDFERCCTSYCFSSSLPSFEPPS
jgi:hypothetical protein